MTTAEAIAERARPILERLVAFDTTSRDSNLALIEWVEAYLTELGVPSVRNPNPAGDKANLIATIGPASAEGGVVLSGHTDVVPTTGQAWASPPYRLTERDGRLYGRGTADMKGFIALALAAAPDFLAQPLAKPVTYALSYDEEIGCIGAPRLIETMKGLIAPPAAVIIGEPSSMQAVLGHKGIAVFDVIVTGREAHSAQTHLGVSANTAAIRLMDILVRLADRLEKEGEADADSIFLPKGATLTVGLISGGTAGNILARECRFQFDLRTLPGVDPMALLADFFAAAEALDAAMKARAPEAGVRVETVAIVPPLAPRPDNPAERLVRGLAGDNGPPRVVSFVAEAGQYQAAGYEVTICGPGSIDQAHQPDEYVEIAQLQRGAAFMARLAETLRETPA